MSLFTLVRGISTGIEAVDIVIFSIIGIVIILAGTRLYTEIRYYVQSRGSAGRFQGRELSHSQYMLHTGLSSVR